MNILCTLLTICAMAVGILSADPEVQTTLGNIRGFQEEVNGKKINTYLGVPFAKPPVGKLRFQPPVPAEAWDATLETKLMGYSCPQTLSSLFPNNKGESMWNAKTELREDCLYLNLWVPNENHFFEPLTTMVWIYGGGFYSGTTALEVYNGKYLAARNSVIVASINYRLGVFGFLYLNDSTAPGNMGLLDQTLALKWIYDNIEKFGGSNTKVSLFGESAGAASVHYHLISPMSRSLFSSVIIQSASALSGFAYRSPSKIRLNSINLAIKLECYNSSNAVDVVECLKSKPAEQLTKEQWLLNVADQVFGTFPFGPTVDGFFLTDTPINLILNSKYSKVPMLLGVNKNEGSYFILYDLVQEASTNNKVSIEEALPYIPSEVTKRENLLRYIPRLVDSKMKPVVLKSILHEYDTTSPLETKQQNINILDSIGGDYAFKCPTISVAKEAASDHTRSPTQGVYLYSFEHRTCTNPWPAWAGVLHGDEIEFIFGMPLKDGTGYTKDEKELSGKIMDYITNFAKTGNPNTPHSQTDNRLMTKVLRGEIRVARHASDPNPDDSVNQEHIAGNPGAKHRDEQAVNLDAEHRDEQAGNFDAEHRDEQAGNLDAEHGDEQAFNLDAENRDEQADNLDAEHRDEQVDNLDAGHRDEQVDNLDAGHRDEQADNLDAGHRDEQADNHDSEHRDEQADNLDAGHRDEQADNLDAGNRDEQAGNLDAGHRDEQAENLDAGHRDEQADNLDAEHRDEQADNLDAGHRDEQADNLDAGHRDEQADNLDAGHRDDQSKDPSLENPPSQVLQVHRPAQSIEVEWPKYTASEERYIVFGDGQTITTSFGLKHKECMFWGRLYPDLMKETGVKCPTNS